MNLIATNIILYIKIIYVLHNKHFRLKNDNIISMFSFKNQIF